MKLSNLYEKEELKKKFELCYALWEKGISVQVTFEKFHVVSADVIDYPYHIIRYNLNDPVCVDSLCKKYDLVI